MVHAEYDGIVISVTNDSVTVLYTNDVGERTYRFNPAEFTSASVIIRSVVTSEGKRVKAGDVLVTSNFIKDGLLAISKDELCCFIPTGYNYEDGVHACQTLGYDMTSYGVSKDERNLPSKNGGVVMNSNVNRFRYIKKNQVLYSFKHKVKSRIVDSLVKSEKVHGFIVDIRKEANPDNPKEETGYAVAVSTDIEQQGDKMANRHGNKGVTPELQPNEDMFYLANGEFIRICYNPAGVSSRMNIGQVLDGQIGLAMYVLHGHVRSDSRNGATEEDVNRLLSYAWHLANDDDPVAVNAMFPEYPEAFKRKRLEYIDQIRFWKGAFNEDGTAWVTDPKTGRKLEVPVVLCVNAIYKLIQEVAKKEHARGGYASSDYIEKLSAPTKGSSAGGGQRMGEMEMAALAAYGAANLIYEYQNYRGDNPVGRNNLTVNAIHQGPAYLLDEHTGIRRSTEYFRTDLDACGIHMEFTNGELPNNTKWENEERIVYTANALKGAKDVLVREDDQHTDDLVSKFEE